MFRRIFWKLTISLFFVIWALISLYPLQDRPFEGYLREQAQANQDQFAQLMAQAEERVQAGRSPTLFIALKEIGRQEQTDLAQFFPEIELEATLRNIERRNEVVLNELLRRSKSPLQLGLDLRGGVAFTLEVAEQALATDVPLEREEKLSKAVEIIAQRVNAFGVTEPIIRPVGDRRIEVQLAGISTRDNPEVIGALRKPARLDFRLVHRTQSPDQTAPGNEPPGYEVMSLEQELPTGEITSVDYFVKRIPEMTGEAIEEAFPTVDEFGRSKIILRFTGEGRDRFSEVTGAIARENQETGSVGQLAIVLDGRLYSAPTVREQINSDSAEITGSFSQREAIELANVLNNPLDLPLEVKEMYEVGPSLAQDSISSGIRASIIGAVLVIIFIALYYTWGGLVALLSLVTNVIILLGVLAAFKATLTLPGLAGIVLTMGMAVDANILIFERIREELRLGKSLKAALHSAYEKVLSTILDANLTTLITCGIMIWLGTGPVKGFGVTLAVGVFSTIFSALVVNKLLLEVIIDSERVKRLPMLGFSRTPNFDYLRYGRAAFIASWAVVLVGVSVVLYKGTDVLGIDFLGGDELILEFAQPVDAGAIRQATEARDLGEINPVYQSELGGTGEVLKIQTEFGRGQEVFNALTSAFPQADFQLVGENAVGPAVGGEILRNAILALGLSLVGILLYVAFRFEMGFGIGAVVSTVHDILMTIGIFVLFDRQFTAPMVAAILLIVGYSINDTIVVFDRIREELAGNPAMNLRQVINSATNKVLSRSLLTSFTTFLAALSLLIFGGGVINDLAFTFIVGVITGGFSSIFIATPVFYWWHKGDRRHVEAHRDIAPKYEWVGASKASK